MSGLQILRFLFPEISTLMASSKRQSPRFLQHRLIAGTRTVPYLPGRTHQFTTPKRLFTRTQPPPAAGPHPGSPSRWLLIPAIPVLCPRCYHREVCLHGTAKSVVSHQGLPSQLCAPPSQGGASTQLCLQHVISLGGESGRTTAARGRKWKRATEANFLARLRSSET